MGMHAYRKKKGRTLASAKAEYTLCPRRFETVQQCGHREAMHPRSIESVFERTGFQAVWNIQTR